MKYYLLLLTLLFSSCAVKNQKSGENRFRTVKIWDKAPHNAFTDLLRFKGNFYCTFREGSGHVSGPNGTARILKSSDGKRWDSVAAFRLVGSDIRDPKLSVTPDQRIMVLLDVEPYTNGKIAGRRPYVSYSDAGGDSFSFPRIAEVDPSIAAKSDWVWRVTWNNGTGYAIDYQPEAIYLLKTHDGSYFEKVARIDVDGKPNESTIRFDKTGKMYVMIRREDGDKMGVLAKSDPPYTKWTISKMNTRLGGPNFLFLNDSTLCIGSRVYQQKDRATKGFTGIMLSGLDGKVFKTVMLPSGGDTSYPGMLFYKNKLWFSYYSSHEGRTAIYLAKIPVSELKKYLR